MKYNHFEIFSISKKIFRAKTKDLKSSLTHQIKGESNEKSQLIDGFGDIRNFGFRC